MLMKLPPLLGNLLFDRNCHTILEYTQNASVQLHKYRFLERIFEKFLKYNFFNT